MVPPWATQESLNDDPAASYRVTRTFRPAGGPADRGRRVVGMTTATKSRAPSVAPTRKTGRRRNPADPHFEQATAEFLQWAQANKRPKTVRSYRQCLARLAQSFAGKRLNEIDPFAIEKHKQARITAGAPVAANRELATLKALFNRCREWGFFHGENPAARVKPVREPKGRLRYIEPEEEGRLLAAAREPLRTIILTGLYAGLRVQAEALTLQKADVDLRHGLLTVQAAYAKSGETRTVPLNAVLREALGRAMSRSQGAFVFARPDGRPYHSIRTAFRTACRRASLAGVSPHTLRHTFASRLAMAGYDLRTIQELGGWKELKMVERYAHLNPRHKAEAVERICSPAGPLIGPERAMPDPSGSDG